MVFDKNGVFYKKRGFMQTWKQIEAFPKYLVSSDGSIKNMERDSLVHIRQNLQGIAITNLMRDQVRLTRSVALIVAQAYLRPPPNEAYNSVIHLNGDRADCSANNLMWRPRWFTIKYHRMFDVQPINVSVQIEETGEIFGTLRDACVKYGLVEQDTYVQMLNNEGSFHYGYHFKRATGY